MGASGFFILYALLALFFVSRIIGQLFSKSNPSINDPGEPGSRNQKPRSGSAFRVEIFDIFTGAANTKPTERSLNCPFQLNGQNYDAFDVLQVPAGAPLEICEQAYKEMSRSGNKYAQNKEIVDRALKALLDTKPIKF